MRDREAYEAEKKALLRKAEKQDAFVQVLEDANEGLKRQLVSDELANWVHCSNLSPLQAALQTEFLAERALSMSRAESHAHCEEEKKVLQERMERSHTRAKEAEARADDQVSRVLRAEMGYLRAATEDNRIKKSLSDEIQKLKSQLESRPPQRQSSAPDESEYQLMRVRIIFNLSNHILIPAFLAVSSALLDLRKFVPLRHHHQMHAQ